MPGRIGNITFDCASPDRLATFWSAVLGYRKEEAPPAVVEQLTAAGLWEEMRDAFGAASDPTGGGPRLFFQRVPEPKRVKNRVHIDVTVGREAMAAEVQRLGSLGATVVEERANDWGDRWTIMLDPEGNEFCVQ